MPLLRYADIRRFIDTPLRFAFAFDVTPASAGDYHITFDFSLRYYAFRYAA